MSLGSNRAFFFSVAGSDNSSNRGAALDRSTDGGLPEVWGPGTASLTRIRCTPSASQSPRAAAARHAHDIVGSLRVATRIGCGWVSPRYVG